MARRRPLPPRPAGRKLLRKPKKTVSSGWMRSKGHPHMTIPKGYEIDHCVDVTKRVRRGKKVYTFYKNVCYLKIRRGRRG